jgi:uncharacterized protein (DUF433 family)
MKTQTGHKYIVRIRGICGGSPIIDGTRIAVRTIMEYIQQAGYTPEEIAQALGLDLSQVYDAMSYYYDHKDEIDKEIAENDMEYQKQRALEKGLKIVEYNSPKADVED